MFDQVIEEMHPEIAKALERIKDSYSSLLNIVVDSTMRQNHILSKQVDILKSHNEKLRQTISKKPKTDPEKELLQQQLQ